jgi:hypothetical protein
MNIFDPLISGSLSVSGSGHISGDLTVLGTINATISGTTSDAISASHAANYTLTSSFGAFTSSYTTGSFTGSFIGDGSGLYNIPASGVTGLNLTRIADGSATASISSDNGLRVNTNTEITGALTISGSITLNGVPVGTGKLDEVVFNSYSSSNNTTNSLQNGRLDVLEVSTSSLNTFTSSATSRLNTIESTTGSLNTFTSSASVRLTSLESASSSIRTDFNTYTSSNNTTNDTQNNRLNSIEGVTSSLNSYTSSNNTNISAIHTATSSLNTFTSSTNNRLTSIETSTSSLNTFTSSASGRLASLESASSSIRTDFNSFTSSNNAVESTQNGRLTSLENVTGSYATTGSNNFIGTQTITGSLFISQNLIVQGSSSLENITASAVSIGTNTIVLNTDSPAFRYAGISVFDSGSTNVTASLFYDSLTNQWKFKHVDTGTNDASIVLFGPLGSDIDNTPLLESNYLTKVEGTNDHGHHLTTSSIFDNGSKVSINSNSEITGSLTTTGVIRSTTTPLVSSSIQIDHNATTNYVANRHIDHTAVSISTGVGSGLTGGGDITTTRNLSIATGGVTNAMLAGSIENGKLSNSSLTIGTTTISLGSSSTTLGGLTSVTSTSFTGSLQGSISGNAATVTTNANLTGVVTSTGNVTTIANGNITNAMLAGSIENSKLSNSSFFIGTTSISLGRGSAAQTLNGVAIDGNAGSATILQTARTIGGVSFNGSANIDLPGVNTSGNQNTSGNAATATEVTRTVGAGSEANLLSATIADNDYFRLRVGGGSNAGFVEIATGDDGTEPIHVRQYTGVFSSLTRTATLLDGSGNTSFPGTVTAPTFSGALSGNASTVTNGVYTTGDQTIGGIKTFSTRINLHQSGAGGGQNLFTGVDATTSANGRAQLILSSAYSDLVIASSQSNNQHGSTLSFTAYNPSNASDYRKFVINQGNWGSRQHMLSFGYSNQANTNPHNDINSAVNVLTLDGINKRLGVRVEDPLYNLHINGTGYFSSNVIIAPTSASWGEGLTFTMPTTSTWGGLRWRRERGNSDGNWYLGFTALDSTDDMVFGANNGGSQVDNILRLQKNGNLLIGTNTPGGRVTIRSTVANSTVLNIQGTSGQLFSVTDSLTGTIFAASDVSGIPILEVNSNGTVTVDDTLNVFGDVTAFFSSDERFKDNVTPISDSIEKMKQIGGYEFDWNNLSKNTGHDVGVIAQEVEKVLPEVVTTRPDGFKAVKYDRLTALLIEANKELIKRVEELERKIK